MNCIFNELCLQDKFQSKEEANLAILNLIEICNQLEDIKFTNEAVKILFNNDEIIWNSNLAENFTLTDWLMEEQFGNERILLQGLLDSPSIKEEFFNENEYIKIQQVTIPDYANQKSDNGLLIANLTYPKGAFSISLPTNEVWDNCFISIDIQYETENVQRKKVRHISKIEHIECHTEWALLQNPALKDWRASKDNLLPRKRKSNEIVNNDWQKFIRETNAAPNKTELIENISKKIFPINGWLLDNKLTSLNQEKTGSFRLIFKPIKGNLYISVDFRHTARFELLNGDGKHLGEYTFTGDFVKDSIDKMRKHEIHLSR